MAFQHFDPEMALPTITHAMASPTVEELTGYSKVIQFLQRTTTNMLVDL